MDPCFMKKVLFALGGAGIAGGAGYYAKQMTGAAVGAITGGVIGYLLARCEGEAPVLSMAPGGGRRLLIPVSPSPIEVRPFSINCPPGTMYNQALQRCQEYAK